MKEKAGASSNANREVPSDLRAFLEKYRISEEKFLDRRLDWSVLKRIGERHAASRKRLEPTAVSILEQLRNVPEVHSLKMRLKDPDHLIEKIIRKSINQPDLVVTEENYSTVITDLIGIRALHLFKGDWKPIHDFVTSTWDLQEPAICYIRKGDAPELMAMFETASCKVQEHAFGYRSIHYLIKSQPTKEITIAELQIRTIFEEGWSEIDHRIRYPYDMDNARLGQFLVMFNRLAGGADEMGTFVQELSEEFKEREAQYLQSEMERKTKEADLKSAIDRLTIEQKEKEKLKKEVEELRKTSVPGLKYSNLFINDLITDGNSGGFVGDGPLRTTFPINNLLYIPPSLTCSKCGSKYVKESLITWNGSENTCLNCSRFA